MPRNNFPFSPPFISLAHGDLHGLPLAKLVPDGFFCLLMREVMSLLMSGVPTLNKPHHAGYCSLDRCSIEPNISYIQHLLEICVVVNADQDQ
jgi:hypothetical protein